MATIRFLGHSAFEIQTADKRIVIDPFFTGNPAAACSAADCSPDVIIVTHGHGDHVGDTVEIAKRTGALVIANFEIVNWLNAQGVDNAHPQHIGGAFDHGFGVVKLTIAHHGSGLPDGSYGGNPAGILLRLPEATIHHAGDTALTYDMKLLADEKIDLAILPIGDNFTMGPDDSIKATQFIDPKRVVPCHYDTWPPIAQDPGAWAERVKAETSADPIVLAAGEECVVT